MPLYSQMEEDEIITGINITPMVDVAFVVLIIFIVTASFVLKENIPLNLPEAESGEQSTQGLINLAINADSQIYLNGRPVAFEELPYLLAQARLKAQESGQNLQAFISADTKAEYGIFAKVVDRLRVEGITEIALDTRPEDYEKAVE